MRRGRSAAAIAIVVVGSFAFACGGTSDRPPTQGLDPMAPPPSASVDAATSSSSAGVPYYEGCDPSDIVDSGTVIGESCSCVLPAGLAGLITAIPCGIGLCTSLTNTEAYCTRQAHVVLVPGCPDLSGVDVDGGADAAVNLPKCPPGTLPQ